MGEGRENGRGVEGREEGGEMGREHLSVGERDVILTTTNLTTRKGEVEIYRVSGGFTLNRFS